MAESRITTDFHLPADELLDDLFEEITAKVQAGEPVDIEQYARRLPQHAERIRSLFEATRAVVMLGRSVSGSASVPCEPQLGGSTSGQLGDFRILREIGRGGMGVVYEAEQISLHRRVALKMLPFAAVMDSKQLQRFQNEALAAASLKHPNIVQVYAVGCERGVHYYAMEYVEGQTLAQVIDQLRSGQQEASPPHPVTLSPPHLVTPSLASPETQQDPQAALSTKGSHRTSESFRSAAQLGIQAAAALEHAHQLGVVHRDIKPSNLMVEFPLPSPAGRGAGGEGPHLLVTDFGLAQTQTGANLTMTGDVLGTLRYMSPEQAQGNRQVLDHRSDIYSLGVTLYELVALEPPFRSDDRHALIHEIVDGNPPSPRQLNRSIPGDLETIVLKAMSAEPQARYATAQELADDLRRFLEDRPIEARPPTLFHRAVKWARRHRPLVWSAVVLLVLCTIGSLISTLLIAGAYEEKNRQLTATEKAEQLARQQEALAKQQEEAAKKQAALAREQQQVAIQQRDAADRNLYVAHMRLAQRDWEWGQISRLHEMLDSHIPEPGRPDLRGWEWYYLVSLCRSDLLTLRGHADAVRSVAWSLNGDRLASGSDDRTVKVWDPGMGQEILTLSGHRASVQSVAWSPDGKRLASGSVDGTARIWERSSGKETLRLRPGWSQVRSVAWSPDGHRLAAGNIPEGHTGAATVVWDEISGLPLAAGKAPERDSPGAVAVWDATTGRTVLDLTGRGQFPVAWSPDGKRLATGTDRWWEFTTWDASSAEKLLTFSCDSWGTHQLHSWGFYSLAWSPDGRHLASGEQPNRARVWDSDTGRELFAIPHPGSVRAIAWSRDGKRLATASTGQLVTVYNAATGEKTLALRGHRGSVNSVAWSPDGTRLASAGDDRTVKIWHAARKQGPRVIDRTGAVCLTWSPRGDRLASAGLKKLSLWDPRTGGEVRSFDIPARSLAWSPDGKRLAASFPNQTVILDLDADTQLVTGGADVATSWSPDGTRLALAHFGSSAVEVRDAATGKLILARRGPAEYGANAVAWSPDGSRLASAGHGVLTIWDVVSGKDLVTLHGFMQGPPAWSPDGKRLAWRGPEYSVRIYDASDGRNLVSLVGHTGAVYAVGWSPDGSRLASGSADGSVQIWDPATGDGLLSLTGVLLAWSPDGQRLATIGDPEGTIRIYDASAGYALANTGGSEAGRLPRIGDKASTAKERTEKPPAAKEKPK